MTPKRFIKSSILSIPAPTPGFTMACKLDNITHGDVAQSKVICTRLQYLIVICAVNAAA